MNDTQIVNAIESHPLWRISFAQKEWHIFFNGQEIGKDACFRVAVHQARKDPSS